ncbi:hypothetical protein BO94DRAFT_512011 [Aspergillus sclerotioniger CBS 115572]|uniref:Nitrogen regulatory protein areA GATA-like domain-containing protein n=1 Tax=Aspergillus sclerotioniger CBS 115572 TaxID=1450535 RepID=A0A317X369_9EURO|nr:hypothetical protein BO94DRAFT_512011 [Aspergillus sclerotioniger CBS 115572]PWY93074.1 hypothetical protein BO94DRAFT_512011 [Aspergillus sclerotioniger CBS 115572]
MIRPQSAVRDDIVIEEDAKVNVDYLAHAWTYEDMWATRKHVRKIDQRSLVRCRFENALWRAWLSSSRSVRTPAASSLGKDKDSDITWFYGPLKSSSNNTTPCGSPSTQSPRKPSLKRKPSTWEMQDFPTIPDAFTKHQSLLGRVWNITIQSVPSILLNSPQPWNKKRKCRVHFEEQVQQCQFARDERWIRSYSPYLLEHTAVRMDAMHTQQTIEPLPSTYLTGFEAFESTDSAHCHAIFNFLEELEYVLSVLVLCPTVGPRFPS